jgi:hypothetical protein
MRRLSLVALGLVVCAAAGLAAQEKTYGKGLTLKEVTKVSDIYANPEKYDGKRVLLQGPVVDVCEDMGCWLSLGSDKDAQTIRFKVEDGVIVIPMSAKGKQAKIEGILKLTVVSEADQIARGEDPKTVKGPKKTVQIEGEGAVIR